jgi:hypothetical protein
VKVIIYSIKCITNVTKTITMRKLPPRKRFDGQPAPLEISKDRRFHVMSMDNTPYEKYTEDDHKHDTEIIVRVNSLIDVLIQKKDDTLSVLMFPLHVVDKPLTETHVPFHKVDKDKQHPFPIVTTPRTDRNFAMYYVDEESASLIPYEEATQETHDDEDMLVVVVDNIQISINEFSDAVEVVTYGVDTDEEITRIEAAYKETYG